MPKRSSPRFNEAAGIHRRKPMCACVDMDKNHRCFNEAAGIHRRKPPAEDAEPEPEAAASMRPPEFTGGNTALAVRELHASPPALQ